MFKPLALLALSLFVSTASAQVAGPCGVSVNAPAVLRAEGLAERLSDIVVVCGGSYSGPTSNIIVDVADLPNSFPNTDPSFVPLPTFVTSKLLSSASSGTEALLVVDDLSSPAAAGTNVFQGVLTSPSQITFFHVPNGGKTYRITNIRVNSRLVPFNLVGATVHIGSSLLGTVLAGVRAAGLTFSLENPAGGAGTLDFAQASLNAALAASPSATGGALTHQLVFTEGSLQSFRKRNAATGTADPGALADQAVPGTDYHTESGFYLSTLPANNGLNVAGLASQGTRLIAQFTNIPDGAAIYVTTTPLPSSGKSSAVLTVSDTFGGGAFSPAAQTTSINVGGVSVGIAPVILTSGSGVAAWEILDADPNAIDSYTFGLVVAYGGPLTGSGGVAGEIGPLSSTALADTTAPAPRFESTLSDPPACANPPCVIAAPNAISISWQIGAPLPAPIPIAITSTGPALSYTVAATANWPGLTSSGVDQPVTVTPSAGGVTPGTLQLAVNPPTVAGLYEGSIVLSSPVTGFSAITIPIYLTVVAPPANVFQCTKTIGSRPTARAMGESEFVGDIVLGCGFGTPTAAGANVPVYDVRVTLSLPVTSRTFANGWSEALLLIDEPGSGLAGEPTTQLACNSPTGACTITGTGNGTGTYSGAAGRPNVFSGRVSGSTVTFPGVPLDPVSNGAVRYLRITNVRADVSSLGNTTPSTVTATVSAGSIPISNNIDTVAYVTPGLATTVRTPDDASASTGAVLTTCPAAAPQQAGIVRFSSLFGTAFKPRSLAPFVDEQTSPTPQVQSIPGNPLGFNSESGFFVPTLISPVVNFQNVGLASAGTRLRAEFGNLPAGTRIWVSTLPVAVNNGTATAVTSGSVARLVQNEVLPFFPQAPARTLDGIAAAELTPVQGTASAVWEVLLSNTSTLQNLDFLVWVSPASNSSGAATVTGSFAPAPPSFSDGVAHMASATLPVPRFAAITGANNLVTVSGCASATPAPDLVVTSLSGPVSANPAGTVSVFSTVLNQGSAAAGAFRLELYFAPSSYVTAATAVDTTGGCNVPGLAAGASYTCAISLPVPGSLTQGTWYLAALADSANQVSELEETNNWRIADTGPVAMGPSLCSLSLAPPSSSLPATGTSNPGACPDPSQLMCGFYPEAPLMLAVTPSAACGAWTATSSDPGFVQIVSGASGTGSGTVQLAVLMNVHTTQRNATVTVTSGAASASYALTQAGSSDSLTYREVYALYQQLLGRDPDGSGFAFWTGSGQAGLGQMADSFLTSPEAFGSDFGVMAAYQAALGVPPTYAQFSAALTSIRAGTQTTPGLFSSLAGQAFTAANLYQNLLGRTASAAEITAANAAGLASTFQTIVGLPGGNPIGAANNEFQSTGSNHTADHSNGLYVRMLYYVILGRDPDASGLNFWVGVANSGGPGLLFQGAAGFGTRIQIMGPGTPNQGFIGSPEFQNLFSN